MNSRAEATQGRIIRAAEQLFAQRGIEGVTLLEISKAAGQKNRNAIQYHFGDKQALLQAIFTRHTRGIAEARKQWVAALEVQERLTLRELVEALVLPVAAKLDDADGGPEYLQIAAQMAMRNTLDYFAPDSGAWKVDQSNRLGILLQRELASLDGVVLEQRMALAMVLLFHGLAEHARLLASGQGDRALRASTLLVSQMVDAIAALLSMPLSPVSLQERTHLEKAP